MTTAPAQAGWRFKQPSVIPGFGLTLGFSLVYLTLIILIPLHDQEDLLPRRLKSLIHSVHGIPFTDVKMDHHPWMDCDPPQRDCGYGNVIFFHIFPGLLKLRQSPLWPVLLRNKCIPAVLPRRSLLL